MSETGPNNQDSGNNPDAEVVGDDMTVLAPTLDAPTLDRTEQPEEWEQSEAREVVQKVDAPQEADATQAADEPDAANEQSAAHDQGAGDERPAPNMLIEGETKDELFNRVILPEVDVMWRVAMSLTRNRADAEDVVQESLLRAYRALHTFDGRYPRAWLLTIVRNTERNRHRRRRPELLRDPDIVEDRGPSTEPDEVESIAEAGDFDAAVRNALEQLPDTFRGVIELVDVDGLSYQEAADVLDVPLGTVMSRLHRARRRIRELLIPLGYGPHGFIHSDEPADSDSVTATNSSAAKSKQAELDVTTTGSNPADTHRADQPANG